MIWGLIAKILAGAGKVGKGVATAAKTVGSKALATASKVGSKALNIAKNTGSKALNESFQFAKNVGDKAWDVGQGVMGKNPTATIQNAAGKTSEVLVKPNTSRAIGLGINQVGKELGQYVLNQTPFGDYVNITGGNMPVTQNPYQSKNFAMGETNIGDAKVNQQAFSQPQVGEGMGQGFGETIVNKILMNAMQKNKTNETDLLNQNQEEPFMKQQPMQTLDDEKKSWVFGDLYRRNYG